MTRLFVLLAAICGWLAIVSCSDSGSSDGSGGASAGGGGGGDPLAMPPNPDGTCEAGYALREKADEPGMVCIKTNDGNGGSSGSGGNGGGGSSGSAGDTPPIGGTGGTSLPDTGFGGSGGGTAPDATQPVEQCAYWEDIEDNRDPCLLAGRWTEMTNGWVEITVTKTSSTMYTVVLEGTGTFVGTITMDSLPWEEIDDYTVPGTVYILSIEIDEQGYLITRTKVNGEIDSEKRFSRNN